jgi:hypothetical protein
MPSLNVPQAKFLQLGTKYRAYVAGFGCLRGSTEVLTEYGPMPIAEIDRPMRVLSWSATNSRYELSLSGGAFPKGKGRLYQVSTPRGVFVASAHHRVLCADGVYRCVADLSVGVAIRVASEELLRSNLALCPKSSHAGGLYSPEKLADYLGHYADAARRYGQRLLPGSDGGQSQSLQQDGAQEFVRLNAHTDDPPGHGLKRIGRSQAHDQNSKEYSKITSLSLLDLEEVYYDLQVLDNNNYVTVDGAVHHNSGKTWVGSGALCAHAWEWPKITMGYFAPSYPQIRDIFYQTIEEVAHDWGLTVDIKQANKEVHLYSGRQYRSTIICRSMDAPQNIVGFKIGHAMVDELDVMPAAKAELAWRKIIARMRYNVDGLKNGVDVTTTPEGFRFTYQRFVKSVRDNPELAATYGLVQASTYDNAANLPDDYISSLMGDYPPQLIKAYLGGEFVNLTSGTVYHAYSRVDNASSETIRDGETLHIGMDFNVGKMAAVVHVSRPPELHAVEEIINAYDTPDMVRRIQERYWRFENGKYVKSREMRIYPDASGGSRKSVNAAESDIALLRQAGFTVISDAANPPVKDRVNAMNGLFLNAAGQRRYKVNHQGCPSYAHALEQQVWAANGEPDKSQGNDHANDAAGYVVAKLHPIVKRQLKTISVQGF